MDDRPNMTSAANQTIKGSVHTEAHHDSAEKHVTGLAQYTDDIPEQIGTLHAYLGLSEIAHGEII